jgi:hypothetical protein
MMNDKYVYAVKWRRCNWFAQCIIRKSNLLGISFFPPDLRGLEELRVYGLMYLRYHISGGYDVSKPVATMIRTSNLNILYFSNVISSIGYAAA